MIKSTFRHESSTQANTEQPRREPRRLLRVRRDRSHRRVHCAQTQRSSSTRDASQLENASSSANGP